MSASSTETRSVAVNRITAVRTTNSSTLLPDVPEPVLEEKPDGWYLTFKQDDTWRTANPRALVTSSMLGKAVIPNIAFENADGSPLKIDTDYFGRMRKTDNPFPGPFEVTPNGEQTIKVWPKPMQAESNKRR